MAQTGPLWGRAVMRCIIHGAPANEPVRNGLYAERYRFAPRDLEVAVAVAHRQAGRVIPSPVQAIRRLS